jgi:hypothetical protein
MMPQQFQEFLNFVRPSDHSKYSPSSADRWLETGCSGSINQSKGIPNETSVYAAEGTLAHSLCEDVVRERMLGMPVPAARFLEIAQKGFDDIEMMDCASQYADVIEYWLGNKDLGDILWWGLEKGVPIYPELGCFGTADAIVVGTKGAAVIDYKHGKGVNVKASTVQLMVYAAGLAKHIPVPQGMEYPITAVVHQPRTSDAAKEHTYSHKELMDFLVVIKRSIDKCEQPNAELNDGNHCFWCPAKRTKDPNFKCPIIAERPHKLAVQNFDKFLAESSLTPATGDVAAKAKRDQAIVKLMTLFPAIEAVVKEGKEEFKERLQAGEYIEGARIVEKVGSRTISGANAEERIALVRQHFPNINPTKLVPATAKLRTITDLEKELGKGKLNKICTQKISKEVEIINEKTREILNSMSQYSKQIGGFK